MQLIMRNIIYILFLIASTFINAQTIKTDFDTFYRSENQRLKPVKYILFNSRKDSNEKIKIGNGICFHIDGERFSLNVKKNLIDTCSLEILKKIKIENVNQLEENEYFILKVRFKNLKK